MKTFTSFLVIAFILFFSCVKSQTWTQKLNWEIHNVYMHQDSATGVKDADVMRNGNICMLVSMNEDALNKLIVMDPSTQQQLWNHDFGKWGALTSQYARAVTATSDTGVLVCENWLSQAAGPITHGFIYKFSATGNILWIDTFLAVTSQQRIAEDIIEDANGNYLALIGDTVYVLNGTNGNINQTLPADTGAYYIYNTPLGTDFIIVGCLSASRYTMSGTVVWTVTYPLHYRSQLHATVTNNCLFILQNDTLQKIDLNSGLSINSIYLPLGKYSSLNKSSTGALFASQGLDLGEFQTPNGPVQGGIVKLDTSGNILGIKSIPFPRYGLSWVSELPNGNLFCSGTYELNEVNPGPSINYKYYMPFCFTTDLNGNGIMDSTNYYWPGDANQNHIVQFADDAIYIQQSFGNTGPLRDTIPGYFTFYNGLEYSDFLVDWDSVNIAGVNAKTCDVNGDGLVDVADMNAYGVMFSFPVNVVYRTSQLPDVSFVPVQPVTYAGDVADFYVIAGNTLQIDSATGIAFSSNGQGEFTGFQFMTSNLGTPTVDMRNFSSPPTNSGMANIAVSRIDKKNRSLRNDTIGIMSFLIPSNYSDTLFVTSIGSIKAIGADGSDIPVTIVNGSVSVLPFNTVDEVSEINFSVYPNPALSFINLNDFSDNSVVNIYNDMGQCVISSSEIQNGKIDISRLMEGNYIINVASDEKIFRSRFIVLFHFNINGK